MEKFVFFFLLLVIGAIPIDGFAIMTGVSIMGILYPSLIALALMYPKSLLHSNKKYITLLIFFTVWVWVSLFWSIDVDSTVKSSFYITQHLLLIIIIDNLVKDTKRLKQILVAYIAGAAVCALGMIYDVSIFGVETDEFSKNIFRSRLFGNTNENSYLISFALLCVYVLFDRYRIKVVYRLLLITFLLVAMFSITISGSRTGFMMAATILGLWGIQIMLKPTAFKIVIVVGLVGVVAFYIMPMIPDNYIERLSKIGTNIEERNFSQREIIWANAGKMVNASNFNVILGEGWGTFEIGYKERNGIFYGAHNFYINQYYTLGCVGVVFLLFYFTILLKRVIPLARKNFLYILFLLIPMISMMTTNWNHRRWWFFLGIIIIKLYNLRQYNENTLKQ